MKLDIKTMTLAPGLLWALSVACVPQGIEVSQEEERAELENLVIQDAASAWTIEVTGAYRFISGVHGLAISPTGRVYFSDSFGALGAQRQIYYYEAPIWANRRMPTNIVGNTPAGLTFVNGDLVISDVGAGSVTRMNANLQVVDQWAVPAPWNAKRHPQGFLLAVTYDGRVMRLDDGGQVTPVMSGLDNPFDLAIAPDGTFWVSEQGIGAGQVSRFDLEGRQLDRLNVALDNPEGLLLDADGGLLIADTGAGRLLYHRDGRTQTLMEGLNLPVMLAEGQNGEVWVTLSGVIGSFRVVAQ